jgi:DNA (cytosine-5)-methyltransferase 1
MGRAYLDGSTGEMGAARMTAYYNEHDPYAAQWLRNLVSAGLIAAGEVDDRDIQEVRPDDTAGFTQCHFFAGIAGWSLALRLAGWPDDRPVWTGSCPCQPFSAAGKGEAFEDDRHLWPVWFGLIRAVRPAVLFGEQVDDAIGWGWLDLVHDDMEAEGYAVRSAVLPACGVGAPHLRDRLWFVGITDRAGLLARNEAGAAVGYGRAAVAAGDAGGDAGTYDSIRNPWSDLEWLPCTDGKARPTRPGLFPLAHGVSARVGKLRAAGNAIVPQIAAEFIRAAMGCSP